jgi:hypothetical protein
LEKLDESKTNFVLELIQNADDSTYTYGSPEVTFNITPTEIEITYEEDGFTAEDVKAICSIGKSARARSGFRYSLGDEGLGFKSVFKVASRAHIQSGPYSFFFEHNVGETGMGLITPQFCERESSQKRGTKITLTLRKDMQSKTIQKYFEDLPEVLILFMRKLRRLDVSGPSSLKFMSAYNIHETGRAVITKSECNSTSYHITTRKLKNLPHDSSRGRNEAEILLAFPLSSGDQPLIEEQDIYAIYPLGKFGFPVRSKTNADRELFQVSRPFNGLDMTSSPAPQEPRRIPY